MRERARIAAAISSLARFARRTPFCVTPRRQGASTETDVPAYSVYVVQCRDGSLYTGIATDVERRVDEHRHTAKGAKYLRGKGPLTVVYQQEIGDRSLALRVESRIKRMPRKDKSDLTELPAFVDALVDELDQ